MQFMVELNAIKKQFEMARRQPPSQPSVPKHAGHAMAAQQLLRRIQSTWEAIEVRTLGGWWLQSVTDKHQYKLPLIQVIKLLERLALPLCMVLRLHSLQFCAVTKLDIACVHPGGCKHCWAR